MEPRAYAGRFLGRRRGGHGGGVLRARARQRHRRLDPRAGALLRRVRPQAELGTVLQPRPVAGTDRVDDRHLGDRPAGPLGRGPVAGAGRDRRRRPARWTPPASRCRRRAPCACRSCASPSGRASPDRRPIPRPRHISMRSPISCEREGAQVSRIARPDFDVTEAFHLYLQASRRRTQRACERGNAGANAGSQGTPAGRRHERRCGIGPRGRHDASRVAAPERAALPYPTCLGRVLSGLGRAALSGDRDRRRCRTCSRARPGNGA